jgi:hypothetical protein
MKCSVDVSYSEMAKCEHLTQEQKMLKCFLCGNQLALWKHGYVEDRESFYEDQSVKCMVPACERCYWVHCAIIELEW